MFNSEKMKEAEGPKIRDRFSLITPSACKTWRNVHSVVFRFSSFLALFGPFQHCHRGKSFWERAVTLTAQLTQSVGVPLPGPFPFPAHRVFADPSRGPAEDFDMDASSRSSSPPSAPGQPVARAPPSSATPWTGVGASGPGPSQASNNRVPPHPAAVTPPLLPSKEQ